MSTVDDVHRIGTDPDVLEVFYRAHVDGVRRFTARRVQDPHTAADVVATVFVLAMERCGGYRRGKGTPLAWLCGIARRVIADEARLQARESRLVGRISGQRLLDADSMGRIDEQIDAERQLSAMYEGLDGLSPDDRALFELVALDEMSVVDAARVLGVKPGTARVRLHRIRRRVRSYQRPRGSAVAQIKEAVS
ncbi:MAG: RNA polymerase sigma factor [Angustibacter sp.]